MHVTSFKPRQNCEPIASQEDLVNFMVILAAMYPLFIESLILGDTYYRYATE